MSRMSFSYLERWLAPIWLDVAGVPGVGYEQRIAEACTNSQWSALLDIIPLFQLRETMSSHSGQGPRFIRYLDPVLRALKELGGSGRPADVLDIVARMKNVPDSERQEVLKSGGLRFDNQVAFARQYLVWAGYLDGLKRGVWSLTEKGLTSASLSDEEALQLFNEQHAL